MPLKIIEVQPRSLAAKAGIKADETLLSINSVQVNDFFDLEYYSNDYQLDLELLDSAGEPRSLTILRQTNKPLGIEPEAYKHRVCQNNCVFCFIDQMPPKMRHTLYKKDDDYLYSYVFGNYITLNNLSQDDLRRIIDQHISPLYISVHSTDNAVRRTMMRYRADFEVTNTLRELSRHGISYHLQIVCVPGFNCGEQLRKSLESLVDESLTALSIGVVPVGLTDHRERLAPLEPFTPELALETLGIIDQIREIHPIVYAADEFYVQANIPIPEECYYNDFPQVENGIGMLRLTRLIFQKRKRPFIKELDKAEGSFLLLTSRSAYDTMQDIATYLNTRLSKSKVRVQQIQNNFFGKNISVSGLLTATDILQQANAEPGESVIVPANIFNYEGITLDDLSQVDLRTGLQRPLLVVDPFFEDWDWI